MRKFLISLFFIILLFFTSVSQIILANTNKINQIPINVEGSKPIAFKKVILKIDMGKCIGWHHDGIFRIGKFKYRWESGVSVGNNEFKIIACEELKNSGYNVLGEINDLLFSEDNSVKARYQLGAIIKDISYNTYAPLAGNFSECNITVEWQIQDTLKKQIIFTSTTNGHATQEWESSSVILQTFRNSIRQLLSNRTFVDVLTINKDDEAIPAYSEIITIYNPQQTHALPDKMEDIMNGVIVIKTGNSFASGFIISEDGYALTAAHVVSGTKEVSVKMKTGLILNAKVIRVDELQDIALIKISGQGHKPLSICNEISSVGSELFAIGTPYDETLSFSVTKGIISGFRENERLKYIQTDASLNPGNSGGPLINKNGKVIGIVSWKIVTPGFEGLSFGVPLDVVSSRLGLKWNEGDK